MVEAGSSYKERWQKVNGFSWVGDGCIGHFEDKNGRWVGDINEILSGSKLPDLNPPRIEILDEESRPFIGRSHPV